MKCKKQLLLPGAMIALVFISCNNNGSAPANGSIEAMNLKRGNPVSCSPAGRQFGAVFFETSCSGKVKKDFDMAMALLHSFEYDEAEKVFANVIHTEPGCAMAYWGVAMANFHPLWAPPTQPELEKGSRAIGIAQSLPKRSGRETDYINAAAAFFNDWQKADHRTRMVRFEEAMRKLYAQFTADKEAAILYSLALTGTADPTDTSFSKQKKAGEILNEIYPGQPDHPGVIHYIIHSFDYPKLASMALPAARKYAAIAPSSSHAQHMPSHIFTRLGLWKEGIASNLAAAESARCYAENTGIKGHWDEEFHALDYLVYSYLQRGDNKLAKEQSDYLQTIKEAYPVNFKVAYAYAAIPARYLLENKMWKEAAALQLQPVNFSWEKYPWQKAIFHFTRLMGSANTGMLPNAVTELKNLQTIYDTLIQQKDKYKADQVLVQIKTGEAWIALKERKNEKALALMQEAANLEDKTQKHPVTPGEVLPARELLGDMLMQMNKPKDALVAYEKDLESHNNRFNGLYGAALAAELLKDLNRAYTFYHQLSMSAVPTSTRPELAHAKMFIEKNNSYAGK
jgi:hypothetical protein